MRIWPGSRRRMPTAIRPIWTSQPRCWATCMCWAILATAATRTSISSTFMTRLACGCHARPIPPLILIPPASLRAVWLSICGATCLRWTTRASQARAGGSSRRSACGCRQRRTVIRVRTRSTDGVGLGALIRADGVLFGGAAAGDFFCAVGPAKLWVHPARDEVIHRLKGIAWGGFANRKGECRVHLCGLFGMVARKQCVAGGEVTGVATGGLHRQFHAGAHQPLGDPCRCLPRFGRVLQMARDGHAARQVPSFYDQIKAQPP
mmetsp:Transcript_7129/g.11684  ORF Transcript_7129/g.11684 Transcript_7129/m.11684 type:complete len:263 (+) Transcript_7129:3899-4687(+)